MFLKFVLDASAIIAFFRELDDGQFLYALAKKGFEIYVTNGVIAEIKKEPELSRLSQAIREGWINVKSVEKHKFDEFKNVYPMLDYAEVEVLLCCLSLKSHNEEYCCVLDEGAGRKIADSLSLVKTGTLGLLTVLNDNGIIDAECKEKLLSKLQQSTFRLRKYNQGITK
jgi:predicted nucleic acid-binding protein